MAKRNGINPNNLLHGHFNLNNAVRTVKGIIIDRGNNIHVEEKRELVGKITTYKISFYGSATNWITRRYVVAENELFSGLGIDTPMKKDEVYDGYSIF